MPDPTIVTLPKDQIAEAAQVMTAAFMPDPAFTHILPDPRHRQVGLNSIISFAVQDAVVHGDVRTIELEGHPAAVAVWQPPGQYPLDRRRQLRAVPRMLGLTVRIGRRVRDLARFGDAIDARFPSDPVWYLQALGVRSDRQGMGLGGALVRQGLQRADIDGIDTYLETGQQGNVGYYQRMGFEVIESPEELFPGGPAMWLMRRSARPTS
ncbi:MAG TPA: GNAT family N-acetyltransferase [Euzebya sp.]|nr:GNAT family N-acetyltransferase [Euzebya sp.]